MLKKLSKLGCSTLAWSEKITLGASGFSASTFPVLNRVFATQAGRMH